MFLGGASAGGRRMDGSYRADQVGSLLRPPALKQAREDFAQGRLARAALQEAEDAAIRDALAMQRAVGLDVVTDGEYRRFSFQSDLAEAVEGFVPDTEAASGTRPRGRSAPWAASAASSARSCIRRVAWPRT